MKNTGRIVIWSICLFIFTLVLHTRENDFAFFYHPDEPGKAEQILTGKWNYHHPMLLLTRTSVIVKVFGVEKTEQNVVVVGRWVSASFAAAAVVALSLLAWCYFGYRGGIPTGLALALHHQLFELSHYMKEDTALLCGVAFVLLGITWFWRRPTLGSTVFLAFACGIAVSGKYLGGILILFALPPLILKKREGNSTVFKRLFLFFVVLAATFALANLPLLLDFNGFRQSFDREMQLVVEGQGGLTRKVPHSQYWSIFLDNSNPLLLLGLAIYLFVFFRTRKMRTLPEWILFLLPIIYTLLLSCSPKSNDRYFLPATALFTCLSVMGLIEAVNYLHKCYPKRWLWPVVVTLIVVVQLCTIGRFRGIITYYNAFLHDDVQEHIEYIKTNLPANAVIAQDERVGLPSPDKPERLVVQPLLPQKIITKKFAADLGSLKELKKQGITHVAVSESSYGRYFLKKLKPQKGQEDDYTRSRRFYDDLFDDHTLLWERKRGTVIYLHPGIRLYELKERK